MQITLFSFIMSLLWFNFYILIINSLRKNDNFIISFSGFPLLFFLSLSVCRLIFNFEIPSSIIVRSGNIFTKIYDFITIQLFLKSFNINVFHSILLIWLIGTIILIFTTIKKYSSFKNNIVKLKAEQNKQTEQVLINILEQKKMHKKIEIIQNENISSPFVSGIFKGKIYLPNINFSEKEFEYIISHEINHFLNNDSLKKILIQSIKILFWWNPFVHLFANNFNQILEIQCDLKTTLNFSDEEKIKYLESINKIIKICIQNKTKNINYLTASSFVETDELESLKQRFRIVLNYRNKKDIFTKFNIILYILASFLFVSSYFIIIQPYYDPSNSDSYQKEELNNSFIIEKSNSSYDVYIDNVFKYNIENLDELNTSLKDVPIYKGKED